MKEEEKEEGKVDPRAAASIKSGRIRHATITIMDLTYDRYKWRRNIKLCWRHPITQNYINIINESTVRIKDNPPSNTYFPGVPPVDKDIEFFV